MKFAPPLLLFLVCAYLLAFPTRLRPELELKPVWSVDVSKAPLIPSSGTNGAAIPLLPFSLGDTFGYLSNDGDLKYRGEMIYGVAMDPQKFVNYSSVSGNIVVQDNLGGVIDSLEMRGYPILIDGRMLLISTNRSEIAEIDGLGGLAWKREYAAIITDIAAENRVLALGTLDSRVELVDTDGNVSFNMELIGSRINTVYGVALSKDAGLLAVVHGIDPQYILVVDPAEEAAKVFQADLGSEFRTTRFIRFLEGGDYLLIEDVGSLIVVDIARKILHRVGTAGELHNAGGLDGDDLVWAVSRGEDRSELLVISLPNRVLFRLPFDVGDTLAASTGNKLFVGVDRYIGMIERVER